MTTIVQEPVGRISETVATAVVALTSLAFASPYLLIVAYFVWRS